MTALIVHCSCPDTASATAIAEALLARQLAACVQILPELTSVYRWKGEIQRDREVLLLIKTEADRFESLCAAIRAQHPYELPEILAVEAVAGLPAYLDWVRAETRDIELPETSE